MAGIGSARAILPPFYVSTVHAAAVPTSTTAAPDSGSEQAAFWASLAATRSATVTDGPGTIMDARDIVPRPPYEGHPSQMYGPRVGRAMHGPIATPGYGAGGGSGPTGRIITSHTLLAPIGAPVPPSPDIVPQSFPFPFTGFLAMVDASNARNAEDMKVESADTKALRYAAHTQGCDGCATDSPLVADCKGGCGDIVCEECTVGYFNRAGKCPTCADEEWDEEE